MISSSSWGGNACAILAPAGQAGPVTCWGYDVSGSADPPAGSFVQVAAGDVLSCGLTPDGSILRWGAWPSGKLPKPRGIFHDVTIDSGYYDSDIICGIEGASGAGPVACFGDNYYGELIVPAGNFMQISAGAGFVCGLRTDTSILCWGNDDSGEAEPPDTGGFTQVSSNCGLMTSGSVECWGIDGKDQFELPHAHFIQISDGCGLEADSGAILCWYPNSPKPPSGQFKALSGGCALRVDGSAVCWQLPLRTMMPAGTYTAVSAGIHDFGEGAWACALHTVGAIAGTIVCWGGYPGGVPKGTFTQLSGGNQFACALRSDGTAVCWGAKDPTNGLKGVAGTFTQISAGYTSVCAVAKNGMLRCWGGLKNVPLGMFTNVGVGAGFACAVRTSGQAVCWGGSPVGAMGGAFTQVSAGLDYICGLETSGKVLCWGSGVSGGPPGGRFIQVAVGKDVAVRSPGVRHDSLLG